MFNVGPKVHRHGLWVDDSLILARKPRQSYLPQLAASHFCLFHSLASPFFFLFLFLFLFLILFILALYLSPFSIQNPPNPIYLFYQFKLNISSHLLRFVFSEYFPLCLVSVRPNKRSSRSKDNMARGAQSTRPKTEGK